MGKWKGILTLQLFLFLVFLQASYVNADENAIVRNKSKSEFTPRSEDQSGPVQNPQKGNAGEPKVESEHIHPRIGHLPDFLFFLSL